MTHRPGRRGMGGMGVAATAGALLSLGFFAVVHSAALSHAPRLKQVGIIPLPGVEGRIDHMALDVAGQRLFVVALGNNTVEVVDLRSGRRIHSLAGFDEPQGVGYMPSPPGLFVANGGDGSCAILDGRNLQPLKSIRLADDADNVRVDAVAHRVYVGFGSGGLVALDGATGADLGRVQLPAHPEAFELEPKGSRVFVNVPESGEVTVLDRARATVTNHWKLVGAGANFPMALDAAGARLFLGCRQPASVLVLDANSGRRLAQVPIDGDADDLWYDAPSRSLFVSCGAGFIDVVAVPDAGPLRVVARVPTADGARTSLFDAARERIYLAVPHRGKQAAEVRIFELAR